MIGQKVCGVFVKGIDYGFRQCLCVEVFIMCVVDLVVVGQCDYVVESWNIFLVIRESGCLWVMVMYYCVVVWFSQIKVQMYVLFGGGQNIVVIIIVYIEFDDFVFVELVVGCVGWGD